MILGFFGILEGTFSLLINEKTVRLPANVASIHELAIKTDSRPFISLPVSSTRS